jgi:hypothetical protein
MSTNQKLGLDELMIVNPGPEDTEGLLLGDDGNFYQVQRLSQEEAEPGPGQFLQGDDGTFFLIEGSEEAGWDGLSEYFLGDDGVLYQIAGPENSSTFQPRLQDSDAIEETGRFFLGEDGVLYEVVR